MANPVSDVYNKQLPLQKPMGTIKEAIYLWRRLKTPETRVEEE